MKTLIVVLALTFSSMGYGVEKDMYWVCASDDDPAGIMVSYEKDDTPSVQVAGINKYAFTLLDKDGDLRFDFNDHKNTFIIGTKSRDSRALKKMGVRNVYNGYYYDFSEKTEKVVPIKFICASFDNYKH